MPVWHEAEDKQLLIASKKGDAEAFGELYERYALSVFRFVFAHTSDRMDAEDLTEEVFLRTWRSLGNYQERGVPFLAFLFRIARNAIIDHYRQTGRIEHTELEAVPYIKDQTPGPVEVMTASHERQELKQKLDQLREDYRNVLVLRFLSDLSPEETAQVMGRSVGAVRVLQHRALNALRESFAPGGQPEHD
jgi:RNA polymerase sigma-70 factor (ECF subfamily)